MLRLASSTSASVGTCHSIAPRVVLASLMRVFVETLRLLGAQPVVCDVFDRKELRAAVGDFGADVIVSELTDLPDDRTQLQTYRSANDRMRREGTRNLLAAAATTPRFLAQSGPGTFYESELPESPRVSVDEAAKTTADLLEAESGVVTIADA